MSTMPRLGPTAVEMLESVHQHRLLSTRQLHELHSPTATPRWTQLIAADLQRHGLVGVVRLPRGMKLLYVTPSGADAVETIGSRTETRRKVVGPEQASGPLQQHTLAVNDVGLCFVRAARERGDDCGPWAWRHEIHHPIGHTPGQRQTEHVISDALLTYQRTTTEEGTSFHYRLIELDRATMPVDDLAAKLTRYARLYRYTLPAEGLADPAPLWRERYSVFPTVLVVLANGTRRRLERRRDIVLALCGQDQQLQDAPEVRIDVCLLADLQAEGPFAAIIRSAAEPDRPVDWLGEESKP